MQFTYLNIDPMEGSNWVLSWRYFEAALSIAGCLVQGNVKDI